VSLDTAHRLGASASQVLGLNRFLSVVVGGTIQIQYLALVGDAQLRITGIDQLTPLLGA